MIWAHKFGPYGWRTRWALLVNEVQSRLVAHPLVNLLLLYYIALTPWPREGRVNGPPGEDDAKF